MLSAQVHMRVTRMVDDEKVAGATPKVQVMVALVITSLAVAGSS